MVDRRGIDEQVEAAWKGFRGRLADRLEQLTDDDWLRIEGEQPVEASTPFVQFAAFGDRIRAEAAGGPLDELVEQSSQQPLDIVWNRPTAVEPYLYVDRDRSEVDRLAVEAVAVLRDLLGIVHPSFLTADGLEVDPDAPTPVPTDDATGEDGDFVEPDVEPMTFPRDRDHLREAVDLCLQGLLETDEVSYDEEGDAPVRCGQSVVFIRVRHDRPAVEVFAEVVLGAQDEERVSLELEILNESHAFAKFFRRGEALVMQMLHPAVPFVPVQFRTMTEAFLHEVDDVARRLAERIGGRRFLDPEPEELPEPTLVDLHPGLATMLELMPDHHLTSARMAALFDHDQHLVLEALQAVRDEVVDLGDEDPALVTALLRKALRAIVDGEVRRHRHPAPVPPQPRRSRQESLLDDEEVGIETLDLGRSA